MPQDSIFDMVNNVEPLYRDLQGLYAKWKREGATWSEKLARIEALALAAHFAEAIENMPGVQGRYSKDDFAKAADEMLEEWKGENRPPVEKKLQSIEAHREFMTLNAHAWFDFMNDLVKKMGRPAFEKWLKEQVRGWKGREKAIDMMAWNDHNSTWFLDYKNIMKTKKIEGDPINADMVFDSLMTMFDIE